MADYYSNWAEKYYSCDRCKWYGQGHALTQGECFDACCEENCPSCGNNITVLGYPTTNDKLKNWHALDEHERCVVIVDMRIAAAEEAQWLKDPSQLPDITDDSFVLHWDHTEENRTVIKHGDRIIHSEPATYECYEHFCKIVDIVKRKYGDAIRDLIPTPRSLDYLGGDKFFALDSVNAARQTLGSQDDDDFDDDEEEDDDDEWDTIYYPISPEYAPYIKKVVDGCILLAKRPDLAPKDLSALAHLRFALQRLPRTTRGLDVSIVLRPRSGRCCVLTLNKMELSIEYQAYETSDNGGDSVLEQVLVCEPSGFHSDWEELLENRLDSVGSWAASFVEYCESRDAVLEISCDTHGFTWDDPYEDEDPWEGLPRLP